ncbi:conserved protein of unknown function [Ruminococcaceae bacterium BL-6]|nr:conserved protein of unknown function [Ruminococcaceae bacterium BL-6]
MRLIDANTAENIIWKRSEETCDNYPKLSGALAAAIGLLDKCPTIDAVPVVRCEKCKYWKNDSIHIYGMCQNPNIGSVKMDTDFCSYGEKLN